MSQGAQLAKVLFYYQITYVLFLVQKDIINLAQLAINAIALVILALDREIQTVSHVQLLSSFSLNIDVWLHVRMDSQKILQILVIYAQNLLLKDVNLAIRHARHVLHFRYPIIQMNVYFAILLANTLMVNAIVEMLKMPG